MEIKREILITADGSHTLFVPQINEHYHSVNGAIQESIHVFIEAGLHQFSQKQIRILEIGFGTGLNAFLTFKEAEENSTQTIEYISIERYPLPEELVDRLNFGSLIWPEREEFFLHLHRCSWNKPIKIAEHFIFTKIEDDSNSCPLPESIDLIYFDAFAPEKQPEMWTQEIFDKLYAHTSSGGIIVTYCAKGEVRRKMQQAGFKMERLPGPPGKRHMLRGVK
ncbi:tRNA (5-methylaminomethyl-2-thiouridine)(34)-methyltransferase MnmD [Parabacteroides sp. PF5-9]|uniref:tRNA (5-methylaminomethyl-2-thiouridine)(34)-methyltransferase MnmD n=1 Tax=Parabacteroides sp. PF5-9 TaxID=1742404 RepID=UPI00247548C9|nr:tRNA (5-methylaminomethyl-2-thiouridine)(34)-methyltransferase MnmD [Parabacteroides sp. PF5-9]MDH6358435.1 tRNA U34 5-methylaminomethyl-2-thiouridine-forming methyltransferase MnmC [Parabacteroides sp. PF5-9]